MELILFDIDGTLTDESNQIQPIIVQQIHDLMHCGYKVGLSTGRSLWETLPIIESIKPNIPTVCLDGRLIYDQMTSSTRFAERLDADQVNRIHEAFGCSTGIIYEDETGYIVCDKTSEMLLSMAFGIPRNIIRIDRQFDGHPLRLYLYDRKRLLECREKLNQLQGISVYFPGEKWAILSRNEVTKYTALQHLSRELGIPVHSVVAFGDGENDIELIQNVGLGIAMENAAPSLCKVAARTAGNVHGIGVSKILEELLDKKRIAT